MKDNKLNVSIDMGCLDSIRKLPKSTFDRFYEMVGKLNRGAGSKGLNIESITNARDSSMRSIRVDHKYRAIGYKEGSDILLLHVDDHDKAYRWAINRTLKFNSTLNRIEIKHFEHSELEREENQHNSYSGAVAEPQSTLRPLLEPYSDKELQAIGVQSEQLIRVRSYRRDEDLEEDQKIFDIRTYEALLSLAAGYDLEFAYKQYILPSNEDDKTLEFADALRTSESRQQFYVPDDQGELLRFLDSDLKEWRIFLHPDQRRIAYHEGYNGPALVRGGAGTGKTVVAMHRAKCLADRLASDPGSSNKRILFTTFTSTLAKDVRQNLKALCPEHVESDRPIIEVINLDRWVGKFLKQQDFEREIVYFDSEHEKLKKIWEEILSDPDLVVEQKNSFIKDEWAQIVQSKGITTEREYLTAKRTGRGTPLDRRKRKHLWSIFEAYRARMIDEGLAEPDDAYREAIAILGRKRTRLPYTSVIVDEAQDMGEPALRLVRAIVSVEETGDQNSLFIVGDAHQRIYPRKTSMRECGIDIVGRAKRLRLNYRTSELTRRYAVSILENIPIDDLDESLDSLSGYQSLFKGVNPIRTGSQTAIEEIDNLVKWVKSKLVFDTESSSSVAVLVRTNKLADRIKNDLDRENIECLRLVNRKSDDPSRLGVRIATMHRAKGLEFDYVAVALLSKDNIPPKAALADIVDDLAKKELLNREKSLLHVACTRARKELRISWNGDRPDIVIK